MKLWIYLLVILCQAFGHSQESKIENPPTGSAPALKTADYIDDSRLIRLLQSNLEKAVEAKELPDPKFLREQLKRTHTSVSLRKILPSATPMPPHEIYQKRLGSVLIMGHLFKCDKCDKWHLGTAGAVVLTPDGVAATNHHVMDNAKAAAFGALSRSGEFYPVLEVLASSDDDDVALIRLQGDHFKSVPLGDARIGEPVAVISHPDNNFFTLTTGIASRFSRSRNRARSPILEITADYARGSSGASVFGPRGAVVGLVSKTRSIYYDKAKGPASNLQMVKKLCVPSQSIRKLIEP